MAYTRYIFGPILCPDEPHSCSCIQELDHWDPLYKTVDWQTSSHVLEDWHENKNLIAVHLLTKFYRLAVSVNYFNRLHDLGPLLHSNPTYRLPMPNPPRLHARLSNPYSKLSIHDSSHQTLHVRLIIPDFLSDSPFPTLLTRVSILIITWFGSTISSFRILQNVIQTLKFEPWQPSKLSTRLSVSDFSYPTLRDYSVCDLLTTLTLTLTTLTSTFWLLLSVNRIFGSDISLDILSHFWVYCFINWFVVVQFNYLFDWQMCG